MATVHAQTLRRAAEIAGGLTQLSAHLGVPERALEVWLTGTQPIPPDVFLRAVDIVTANQINGITDAHVVPPRTGCDSGKPNFRGHGGTKN
jgi:DNA-binding transcriptional regulator YdaS (Cro superfamily)